VLARLNHPNVVELYEIGVHESELFLVMELIEGVSLDRWLAMEPRRGAAIVEIFVGAGEGLAAAHAKGVIHRDFKPANVLVDRSGRARVLDFGLARPLGPRALAELGASVRTEGVEYSITGTGRVSGTPGYIAPERFSGVDASPQTDVYSFCVALLEALSGAAEFGPADVGVERNADEPRSNVPRPILDALLRGVAADPAQRWASMEPLLERLREAGEDTKPSLAHCSRVAIVLLAVGVALVLVLVLALRSG
jgi:eukaryotic-like serine/threonine-protein kinase